MIMRITRLVVVLCAAALLCAPPAAAASSNHHPSGAKKSGSRSGKTTHVTTHRTRSATSHPTAPRTRSVTHASTASRRSNRCRECDRDEHGRIVRSDKAKDAFERATGYPHGRPGYVIDHIVPLACGGPDLPSNMQWQTAAQAKTKDKTERAGCGRF